MRKEKGTRTCKCCFTPFSKYNLEFTFFDAIMENKMPKEELVTKALKNTFLTPSEIGCALSYTKFISWELTTWRLKHGDVIQ